MIRLIAACIIFGMSTTIASAQIPNPGDGVKEIEKLTPEQWQEYVRSIDGRHEGWGKRQVTIDKTLRSVRLFEVLEFLSDAGDLTFLVNTMPAPLSGVALEDARVTLCAGKDVRVVECLRDVCSQAGAMCVFRHDLIEIVPYGEGVNRLVLEGYSPYRSGGGLLGSRTPRDSVDTLEPRKCISLAYPPGFLSPRR